MHVPRRHLLNQGPVIATILRTAASVIGQKAGLASKGTLVVPSPPVTGTVSARPDGLINDYLRHVGGSPSAYKRIVPAHLFPQWGFPLIAPTLDGIPYDITRVLNGGCRIEIHEQLPRNERLQLSAQLVDVDDNGYRAVLRQELSTTTRSAQRGITSTLYAIVPLKRRDGPKRERPRVPADARQIGEMKLRAKAGLEFAVLTGDFNPIHWIPPAARASGFRNCILHGFSTLARAIECLNTAVFAGDVNRLHTVDVKFVKPVVLPTRLGVFVDDAGGFTVGAAPGGPANLTGTYTTRD